MISVVVITFNEESRIKACLESVKWADEIVIVDNGSTDKTLEIAKRYTGKIFEFKSQDFAVLRNKATEKTTQDWVLYVDADERVLKSLKDEIIQLVNKADISAYAISRRNIVFGQEVKYAAFWPDRMIRLIKKADFEEWVGQVHEHPRFKGKLGYTKNSLLHLTHRDLDHFMKKHLEWSKIDAKLRLEANHPKMTSWRFFRILFSSTFQEGVLRGGFFGGTVGVIDSILQSFAMFITYVRLWEMQQPHGLSSVYDDIDTKLIENNFNF